MRDVMVVVLDRPRHEEGIAAIREAGARVRLITDGDVAGALLAVTPDRPVDLLWGIGGTPEGVISAAALKCFGGALIGRLWPRDDDERQAGGRRRLRRRARAHARRSRQGRQRVLLGHRRHRRRRAPGRALRGRARGDDRVAGHAHAARAPCGASSRATTAPSCGRSPVATDKAPQQRDRADERGDQRAHRRGHGVSPMVTGARVVVASRSGRRRTPRARGGRASAGTRA